LRVRGTSASWVLRYTAPSGRRREMGLGLCRRGNSKETGESLTGARDAAAKARAQTSTGMDPIDSRQLQRRKAQAEEVAARIARMRHQITLARAARDYHQRAIEPRLSAKHAAQWISSLENHVPSGIWNKPIGAIEPPELLSAFHAVKPHERARNVST
ncbi:MAG: integrase arm-type DNA-binding domain-containing protein, partial [Burkholderiales bacterium]